MSRRQLRSTIFRIHTWLGLHLSLFLAFLFLTGSILVIAPELEYAGHPGAFSLIQAGERTATMGQIYDSVTEANPDTIVVVTERRYGSIMADRTQIYTPWGEMVNIWTDPKTAAVSAVTSAIGFKAALKELHESLFVPFRVGYVAVSAFSFLLLTMIVSGLVSYRRFWKGLFRWPTAAGRRGWLGGLHRLLALWSLPLLAITAVTGIYFFLGGLGINGHHAQGGKTPPRETVLPAGFDGALIDRAVAVAQARVPGFDPKVMVPPQKRDEPLSFGGPSPLADSLMGMTQVTIDPMTLEVMRVIVPGDHRGTARLKQLVSALHFGTWWGDWSKILWVVLGLVSTGLAVSGAMVFAARTAPGQVATAEGVGGFRRLWRGLGLFRWGYVLALLVAVGLGVYIHGPFAGKSPRLAAATKGPQINLVADGPFRKGHPATLTIRANKMADLESASYQVGGDAPQPIALHGKGAQRSGSFQLVPGDQRTLLTLHLVAAGGGETAVEYRLGRAVR